MYDAYNSTWPINFKTLSILYLVRKLYHFDFDFSTFYAKMYISIFLYIYSREAPIAVWTRVIQNQPKLVLYPVYTQNDISERPKFNFK